MRISDLERSAIEGDSPVNAQQWASSNPLSVMSDARSGANTIVVSAVLFVIFAAIFGKLTLLGAYGPAILLILAGIWVFVRGLWRKGQ